MKANALTLLVAIALAGCTSLDHGRTSSIHPYLAGIQEFLQGYVDAESTNQLDFFFVSPVRKERGEAYAYAYWMTGNSIIILDLPIGKMQDYFWYWYKARVDLTTDVVATSEDIGGSTYLVDARWAQDIIHDSLQSGVKVVIQKKKLTTPRQPAAAPARRTSITPLSTSSASPSAPSSPPDT
jgi:hypothetical protein